MSWTNYNRTSNTDDVRGYPSVKAVQEEDLVTWRNNTVIGLLCYKINVWCIVTNIAPANIETYLLDFYSLIVYRLTHPQARALWCYGVQWSCDAHCSRSPERPTYSRDINNNGKRQTLVCFGRGFLIGASRSESLVAAFVYYLFFLNWRVLFLDKSVGLLLYIFRFKFLISKMCEALLASSHSLCMCVPAAFLLGYGY